MTHEQQSKLLGEFYAEKKNILKLKGEDYANEDVLSNFKSAGANIGISAELQCLSLIATKVARLGKLLSGKTPNNESISDSILYLSNYTDLLYCLVNEQITDDLKSVKENILKKQQDIIRDFEMKPNNLLDEKYILHEPKTKRWENVEPIKDTYVPKVGDRFRTEFGRIWEVIKVERLYCVLVNDNHGDVNQLSLENKELIFAIESGLLKKIN